MRFTGLIGTAAGIATLTAAVARGQVCTGDCGHDGDVTIDDLIKMVAIAQMSAMLDACTAADPSGDGTVTIDEIITAVGFALTGCPVANPVTIRVGSVSAGPGMTGAFSVSLATAGEQIDAVQHELQFPAAAPVSAAATGDPDCISTTGNLAAAFLPIGCAAGPTCEAIRITYLRSQIPDGTVLYSCTVRVAATAAPGSRLPLTCANATYVNSDLDERSATCIDGVVQVTP